MERFCAIVCLVGACGFTPGSLPGRSDAAVTADGTELDAPAVDALLVDMHVPAWVPVETITVPVNGIGVLSTMVLANGVEYRLRASGTWVIQSAQGTEADAEWWDFAALKDTVAGAFGPIDVGLAVNDVSINDTRTPKWGPYNASHVYEVPWTGAGLRILAQVHDGNYTNNTGSLTLTILAWQ